MTVVLDEVLFGYDDPEERERLQQIASGANPSTTVPGYDPAQVRGGQPAPVGQFSSNPEAAAEVTRIAAMDPAAYDAQRDRPAPVQLPEMAIRRQALESMAQPSPRREAQPPVLSKPSQTGSPKRDEEMEDARSAAGWKNARARIALLIDSLASGQNRDVLVESVRNADAPVHELEERRRHEAAAAAQREQRDYTRGLQVQQRNAQDAETARRAGLEERRLGLEEQQLATREASVADERRLTDARLGLLETQRTASQGDVDAQSSMRDPNSEESRAAQDLLRRMMGAAGVEIDPSGLSAARIEAMPGIGQTIAGSLSVQRSRRTGGGGGGGAGLATMRADTTAALVQAGRTQEEAERLARLMSTREMRGTARTLATSARAGAGGHREILPGVRAGIQIGDTEAREMRNGFAGAMSRTDSLRALDEIGRRYGPQSVINPRAAGELGPHLMALRAMAADIQGTGVINPSEVETINNALPNPSSLSGQTFGTLQGSLRNWRRVLESKIAAGMRARGVDDAGVQRTVQALRTGRFAAQQQRTAQGGGAPSATGGDRVRIRYQGRELTIPRERLEAAQADGAEVVSD